MQEFVRPKYKVELSKDSEKLPYSACFVNPIELIKHPELFQGGKWSEAKISLNVAFIGVILNLPEKDILYIWRKESITQPLHVYEAKKIFSFEFARNNLSFVVIYQDEDPVHYNIKSGKKILSLQCNKAKMSKVLALSFSEQSRYFALANETHFLVWDVLSGENKVSFKDAAPSKYIRNDLMVTISDKGKVKIICMTNSKKIADFTIPIIALHTDILSCMLTEDKESFYYAKREGVYRTSIRKVKEEEVLYFDQTYPSKAYISSDCKTVMSTDLQVINFWEVGRSGRVKTIPRQPFKFVAVSFESTSLVIMDNISIIMADYTNFTEQCVIWTNLNPTSFQKVSYSAYGSFILTIIDANNAVLWNAANGKLIRKWNNQLIKWSNAICLSPNTSQNSLISVKSSENLIEILDCNNGTTRKRLTGFNAFTTKFNQDGSMLLAGTFGGNDIARLWTLSDQDPPKIFKTTGMNLKTCVDINFDDTAIICHSANQNPCVFEVETAKLRFECTSSLKFDQVDEVVISSNNRLFFSKGFDSNNNPIAVLWNLESNEVIKEFSQCTSISFSPNSKHLVTNAVDSQNPDNSKISIWEINDDLTINSIEIDFNSLDTRFLPDSLILSTKIIDNNMIRFALNDVKTGQMIGEVKYIPEDNGYAFIDVGTEVSDQDVNLILYQTTLA